MTYGDRIQRWVVVRLLPKMQRVDVARFYRCSDAEGYAQTLQRLDSTGRFEVMFDGGEQWKDREDGGNEGGDTSSHLQL